MSTRPPSKVRQLQQKADRNQPKNCSSLAEIPCNLLVMCNLCNTLCDQEVNITTQRLKLFPKTVGILDTYRRLGARIVIFTKLQSHYHADLRAHLMQIAGKEWNNIKILTCPSRDYAAIQFKTRWMVTELESRRVVSGITTVVQLENQASVLQSLAQTLNASEVRYFGMQIDNNGEVLNIVSKPKTPVIVTLVGPPASGKSRCLRELSSRLISQGLKVTWVCLNPNREIELQESKSNSKLDSNSDSNVERHLSLMKAFNIAVSNYDVVIIAMCHARGSMLKTIQSSGFPFIIGTLQKPGRDMSLVLESAREKGGFHLLCAKIDVNCEQQMSRIPTVRRYFAPISTADEPNCKNDLGGMKFDFEHAVSHMMDDVTSLRAPQSLLPPTEAWLVMLTQKDKIPVNVYSDGLICGAGGIRYNVGNPRQNVTFDLLSHPSKTAQIQQQEDDAADFTTIAPKNKLGGKLSKTPSLIVLDHVPNTQDLSSEMIQKLRLGSPTYYAQVASLMSAWNSSAFGSKILRKTMADLIHNYILEANGKETPPITNAEDALGLPLDSVVGQLYFVDRPEDKRMCTSLLYTANRTGATADRDAELYPRGGLRTAILHNSMLKEFNSEDFSTACCGGFEVGVPVLL